MPLRFFTSATCFLALFAYTLGCSATEPRYVNQFTHGPIVHNVSSNQAAFVWATALPSTGWVEYGLTPALGEMQSGLTDTNWHEVTLTNLIPGMQYFYRIQSQDATNVLSSPPNSFKTGKLNAATRFHVIGDTRGANHVTGRLAYNMSKRQPDFVLHLGDMVDSGVNLTSLEATIFRLFDPVVRRVPFFTMLGNHDVYGTSGEAEYQKAFNLPTNTATGTELYYSFDYGNAHFVVLNVPDFGTLVAGDPQYNWLTNDLAATRKPWKILSMHVPIMTAGSYNFINREASALLPVARQFGVHLLLGSHDHDLQRFAPTNGMSHVISGGGGANLYSFRTNHPALAQFWPSNHFLDFSIQNDTLTLEAVDPNGMVFDGLTLHLSLSEDRVWPATWNSPVVEATSGQDGDGNITDQTFDLTGEPLLPRTGDAANLGRFYVNNDATNLYLGFKQVMIYPGSSVFLFLELPHHTGVATMAGLGNGLLDPMDQGVDGLDSLKNLTFTNFTPALACVLGNEFGDGLFRSFQDSLAPFNTGQGVFWLNSTLDTVEGAYLQQFNRSPQPAPTTGTHSYSQEDHADFIELAIPLNALGDLKPGDVIQVAAVVGGAADTNTMSRHLDTAALATSMQGSGFDPVVLGGVRVRLAYPPNQDTDGDGLADQWEISHGLDPASAIAQNGAEGDPDGDGISNVRESYSGTHPYDFNSALKLQATVLGGRHCLLQWPSIPGQRYQLEYAVGDPTNFQPLTGSDWPRQARDNYEVFVDDLPAQPQGPNARFYRIRLVP